MSERISVQTAPGRLEIIRHLLNTWHVPNETRKPVDDLATPDDVQEFLVACLPTVAAAPDSPDVKALRDDLRTCVKTRDIRLLNRWLKRFSFHVAVSQGESQSVKLTWHSDREATSACVALLDIVLESIQNNQWTRLKACPGCQWIYYDNTRNGAKVWCGMTKGTSNGRACGTIAKVNRWREKKRAMNT